MIILWGTGQRALGIFWWNSSHTAAASGGTGTQHHDKPFLCSVGLLGFKL
jgi:hypothetical protein